ncbi:hypothetical protein KFE25_000244 [Diacronema lutheri]|uniref:Mitochondrial import inner membrane translocase subunit n=1 Tax=Diacronema lutheri TaxID=2081491 RepID=A0A8J6CAG7_DIALT|nr:hypothetical protein KFE25_000244 [Diacronema lutheri]
MLGFGGGASSAEAARVAEQQRMQQASSLRDKEMRDMYHRITRVCFEECVHTFAFTKHFLPGEAKCIETCALKYYQLSMSMGASFAEMYMESARR